MYICPSTILPVMFLASQPSLHFVIHSQIAQGAESAGCGLVGGLPLSIEDSAHNLRYTIHNGLYSVACLIRFPPLAS